MIKRGKGAGSAGSLPSFSRTKHVWNVCLVLAAWSKNFCGRIFGPNRGMSHIAAKNLGGLVAGDRHNGPFCDALGRARRRKAGAQGMSAYGDRIGSCAFGMAFHDGGDGPGLEFAPVPAHGD